MLTRSLHRQRGLSLVELMVGVTVGLFVAAAAAMLAGTQLADNRRLLTETQIQQDLRSTADIITREVRRAGYYESAGSWVWPPTASPGPNPMDALTVSGDSIEFKYVRGPGVEGPFRFRYDSSRKAILTLLPGAGEQELTDPRVLKVTAFNVTPVDTGEVVLPCPKRCPDGTESCWPRQRVREYEIEIAGQSATDASVQRSLKTTVRLRNDQIRYMDPLNPTEICPA